jgi:hypothetical protein
MRLLSIRSYERFTRHYSDNRVTYHVTLYRQPLHRWLAARVYRWYDMRVYKVPGFKLLENVKAWRWRNREWYVPISAEQDCRCYHLEQLGRTVLATFDVDSDTYQRLDPRGPMAEAQP